MKMLLSMCLCHVDSACRFATHDGVMEMDDVGLAVWEDFGEVLFKCFDRVAV